MVDGWQHRRHHDPDVCRRFTGVAQQGHIHRPGQGVPMTDAVVTAADVTHTFGSGPTAFTALRAIDLEIRKDEVLLLMGPSGSGKTTLLHILGCLLRPTAGVVTLQGEPTGSLNEDQLGALRLQHFGFVFQAYNLFPVLTATENVMVALDLMGVAGDAARDRARELLTLVGLANRLDAYPSELSSGQKQRVAIARALAGDPQILMADEPTAALDAENGLKAMELFRMLAHRQHRAVVIVTHDPRIVHLADRIVRIEDGRIAPESAAATVSPALAMGAAP
ncbi:MAG TPA: ABC transporter ATP-binding protein [Bradyrhizobium sp.]|uniref:ABC transporter ATP-binding protein n=1 Tax=Bradyrhizobium sp. TaxID=376 RepID=UPI002BBA47EA|nr:ABC transporter ATP-binding protein [Bradyrhizobium sp.]HLZ04184.1 ABC transporter ATP-binding protein [Bradyrhizobium sp.]